MITLDQIVSSNLQMLKSQEAELLKALDFVQKAKQLFTSRGDSGSSSPAPKAKGRSRRKASKKVVSAVPKTPVAVPSKPSKPTIAAKASNPAKSSGGAGKETRLSKIISAMKQKKAPIASGELIETLFKQQKEDRNFPHFRQLVYTTLTQAFKRGIIKRKGDKIHLV